MKEEWISKGYTKRQGSHPVRAAYSSRNLCIYHYTIPQQGLKILEFPTLVKKKRELQMKISKGFPEV